MDKAISYECKFFAFIIYSFTSVRKRSRLRTFIFNKLEINELYDGRSVLLKGSLKSVIAVFPMSRQVKSSSKVVQK
ncbi:MAG: hypothetical protein RL329_1487 [Bacteroidota bacterium]